MTPRLDQEPWVGFAEAPIRDTVEGIWRRAIHILAILRAKVLDNCGFVQAKRFHTVVLGSDAIVNRHFRLCQPWDAGSIQFGEEFLPDLRSFLHELLLKIA